METTLTTNGFKAYRVAYAAARRMPPHRDRRDRISIVLRGCVRETALGYDELGVPTSVVVKPRSVVHANLFGPQGAELLSLEIPHALLETTRVLERWRWIHLGPVTAAAARLAEAVGDTELEEEALDLLAALDCVGCERANGRPPRWLEQVRERLEGEFASPRMVVSLAAESGVHPVYLTRTFRKFYGCSVTGYIRRLRVRTAAKQLTSSDDPLAQVALESGFSDQSHMCRVFKRETGVSPGRFRAWFDPFNTRQH